MFPFIIGSLLMAPKPTVVSLSNYFAGTAVEFESTSGAKLKGNLLPGKKGMGAIILMHGVRGHRGSMARHAEFLHGAGHSVLLFDFQAHGESTGEKITSGFLESLDAIAAVDFVKKHMPDERVGVLGSSLGGVACVLADPPMEIDAAVLEMVYPDIDRAVANRIAIVMGDWARPFSFLLTSQLRPRLGVSKHWFSPIQGIKEMNCPKLIVGGEIDRHTTLADTKNLHTAASEPKELWIVKGAAHENFHATLGRAYEEKILEFFREHINGKDSVSEALED